MAKKWKTRTEAVGFDPHPGHPVKKFPSLSSSSIKLIAIVAMLVDHIGLLFFPEDPFFRIIGRIAFPIFAFLIAEGYGRTSNIRNYLFRLLGFAVISQLAYAPFNDASGGNLAELNIFFTLSAGLIAIILWNRFSLTVSIPATLLICLLAEVASFDYGLYGIVTVLVSRLVLTHRMLGITSLLLLPEAITLLRLAWGVLSLQFFAVLSVPFVALYNGKRGFALPRLFFYGFYPIHLILLSFIAYLL